MGFKNFFGKKDKPVDIEELSKLFEAPKPIAEKPVPVVAEALPDIVPNSFPFNIILVLHQNNQAAIQEIINSSEFQDHEELLIRGMISAWRGDFDAIKELNIASLHCTGVAVGWAHLALANFYLDMDSLDFADSEISRCQTEAQPFALANKYPLLFQYLQITKINIAIQRGQYQKANNLLTKAFTDITNQFLRAILSLSIAELARYYELITFELRKKRLNEALETFQACRDRYYIALTKLEFSYIDGNPQNALKLAEFASDELNALGRIRDAQIAFKRVTELKEQINSPTTTISESRTIQRHGKCLFIPGAMNKVFDNIERAAISDRPVLLTGETGVGKSAIAEAIHHHRLNPRRKEPFITVSCADFTEGLLESQLFGYEPGAYSDSKKKGHKGFLWQANRGTLFLDEIGELPAHLQPKLLAVLSSKQYWPLQSDKPIECDVRFIFATNRNLLKNTAKSRPADKHHNTFRDDLFSRISAYNIEIPGLAKRRNEILPLAEEFLSINGESRKPFRFTLSDDAKQFLLTVEYPHNIRDLENYIVCGMDEAYLQATKKNQKDGILVITANTLSLVIYHQISNQLPHSIDKKLFHPSELAKLDESLKDISDELLSQTGTSMSETIKFDDVVNDLRKKLVLQGLIKFNGHRQLTADYLSLDVRRLYRMIDEFKINNKNFPE